MEDSGGTLTQVWNESGRPFRPANSTLRFVSDRSRIPAHAGAQAGRGSTLPKGMRALSKYSTGQFSATNTNHTKSQ
jgi:hypothetical protein